MGLYVATLGRIHLEQNLGRGANQIANNMCMSIDVQHGEHFQAPPSNARRMRDLEAACTMIAAIWPSLRA